MNFTSVNDPAQNEWDSESRSSGYSTVCDPHDEDYCEGCDQTVDYTGGGHGVCGCDTVYRVDVTFKSGTPAWKMSRHYMTSSPGEFAAKFAHPDLNVEVWNDTTDTLLMVLS